MPFRSSLPLGDSAARNCRVDGVSSLQSFNFLPKKIQDRVETKGLALPPALQQLCSHLVRHRTDDAKSGSHLAFLLFPHPFIFSLYRKRSHNCKVQPVKKKHRTLRNTLASTAFVPRTSFTCHTNACKLCIKCPASKPGQLLNLFHLFQFSLMLLYQEEGICYSLHGRRSWERNQMLRCLAYSDASEEIMCHTI